MRRSETMRESIAPSGIATSESQPSHSPTTLTVSFKHFSPIPSTLTMATISSLIHDNWFSGLSFVSSSLGATTTSQNIFQEVEHFSLPTGRQELGSWITGGGVHRATRDIHSFSFILLILPNASLER